MATMLSMPSIYFPFPPESTAIPPAKQIPAMVANMYVRRFNIADSSFGSENINQSIRFMMEP